MRFSGRALVPQRRDRICWIETRFVDVLDQLEQLVLRYDSRSLVDANIASRDPSSATTKWTKPR
jgi:hypothetical protein